MYRIVVIQKVIIRMPTKQRVPDMSETIDLHVHTTASDGSVSPEDVIRIAAQKKLRAIAITDHDTTDGLAVAHETGLRLGIEVVPGIELSTRVDRIGSMHLLGLWVDVNNGPMQSILGDLREGRNERNQNIIKSLADLGMPIDLDSVKRHAGGRVVGRLHIASVMIDRGYVSSHREAFEKYLGYGKPAYCGRKRLDIKDAIVMIRNAGGVSVLAHPGIVRVDRNLLEVEIKHLVSCGLGGLEAIHTDHKPEDVQFFRQLAERYGVPISGGSDFHGESKPGIEIGSQSVPYGLLTPLKNMRRPQNLTLPKEA